MEDRILLYILKKLTYSEKKLIAYGWIWNDWFLNFENKKSNLNKKSGTKIILICFFLLTCKHFIYSLSLLFLKVLLKTNLICI